MDQYESNSYNKKSSPPEKKTLKKVIKGGVTEKKSSGIKKVLGAFVSEDVKDVKGYVIVDILIPAIKKAVYDIFSNGMDMILYGKNGSRKNKLGGISYRDYYDGSKSDRFAKEARSSNAGSHDYRTIALESRHDAEEVLRTMDEAIETYGIVSISDFYDLVGVEGNYTDCKYGWTNLSTASIVSTRDGYLIKLPRATPIN